MLLTGVSVGAVGLGLQAVNLGASAQAAIIGGRIAEGDPELGAEHVTRFYDAVEISRKVGPPGVILLGVGGVFSVVGWGLTW